MPLRHHTGTIARDLEAVFSVPAMHRAWRNAVRTGLRRQALTDIHDFLDVHLNILHYLQALRAEVLSGQYRPSPPEITLEEKRIGIPRRICIPSPSDAILLQTLVDTLERAIASRQPHPNAYYSRAHDAPTERGIDGTFAYLWWVLWPHFQRRIWRFARSHDYVVITDLANYFDTIPLSALRNRISAFEAFNETVLNFLFFLLDAFTWRPFYMPQSGVGLPQINFDAPRLLAHAFLFPVDEALQHSTGGDYVRWMDDINCGVDNWDSARRLLRDLEIVLNSLGVRLNARKTKILSAEEALRYFWVTENQALNVIENSARSAEVGSQRWHLTISNVKRRYRSFRRLDRVGHWEKIYKRYFTIFGRLRVGGMERDVPLLLNEVPALREPICRYYTQLGPSRTRLRHLADFLTPEKCLDDISLFAIVRVLVAWIGQIRGFRKSFIVNLVPIISRLGSEPLAGTNMTVCGVSSAIWLLAKYGTVDQLARFLEASKEVWTRSSWAARQVAAITPLLHEPTRNQIRGEIRQSGLHEGLRVLASLEQLSSATILSNQLRRYLLHPHTRDNPYPLGKAILARVLLHGRLPNTHRVELRRSLLQLVDDPCYLSIIRRRDT